MDPVSVNSFYDPLCAKYETETRFIAEFFKNGIDRFGRIFSGCFNTPTHEDLVGMVMVMPVLVMAAATAFFTVFMMVMLMFIIVVIVVVVMVMLVLLIVVIVVVVMVMFVLIIVVIIVVVMMVMFVFIVVVIIVVVMMVMFVFIVVIIVVMMRIRFFLLMHKQFHCGVQGVFSLNRLKKRCAVKLRDGRGHDHCRGVLFAHERNGGNEFFFAHHVGVAHDDGSGVFNLIVEKLAEILHIHFALAGVHNRGKGIQRDIFAVHVANGFDYVREFTDAGRFDQDTVRCVGGKHFF